MPQPTTSATTSTTRPAKSSTKTKKKNFAFDGLSRSDIIALLKQKWKDEEKAANANSKEEENDQESKASSKASITNNDPYYLIIKNYLDIMKLPHQTLVRINSDGIMAKIAKSTNKESLVKVVDLH